MRRQGVNRTPAGQRESGHERLLDELGAVPGLVLREGEPLDGWTTFRIGGPAELLLEVGRESALRRALPMLGEAGLPVQLLGLGSNILIPDEGLPGAVIRLTGGFLSWRIWEDRVTAGAGLPLPRLVREVCRAGLVGIEALSGFPSTVGGGVWMNAGCYGTEIRDVLAAATLVEPDGDRRRIGLDELGASYRSTRLQGTGSIVSRATLQLRRGDGEAAMRRVAELNARRRRSLPSGRPNAGSIFKNPPGDYAGRLIEAAGLKGRRHGGAEISSRHANVIVNQDGATARDVLALMRLARQEVEARFGIELVPEIVLAGGLAEEWRGTG